MRLGAVGAGAAGGSRTVLQGSPEPGGVHGSWSSQAAPAPKSPPCLSCPHSPVLAGAVHSLAWLGVFPRRESRPEGEVPFFWSTWEEEEGPWHRQPQLPGRAWSCPSQRAEDCPSHSALRKTVPQLVLEQDLSKALHCVLSRAMVNLQESGLPVTAEKPN